MLTPEAITAAYHALRAPHAHGVRSGFEVNDRQTFVARFLSLLGYTLANVLVDVSQRQDAERRSYVPDIRVFGNDEVKTKDAHAQLVFETKNFGMYRADD